MLAFGEILIATVVLVVLIWLVRWLERWVLARLEGLPPAEMGAPELIARVHPHVLAAGRAVTRLVAGLTIAVGAYLWLVYGLARFSYTAAFGQRLGGYLVRTLGNLGAGALHAVPGLVVVVLIVLVARWCTRIVRAVFDGISAGTLRVRWLHRDTAHTTQILVVVAVWVVAIVVAYPHIPGSNTEAFKGVSVLLGLMVTLGSTGIINQIISGLFVTYSRSLHRGDHVLLDGIEGEVLAVGPLATKLRTAAREEVTVPHSVLVAKPIVNASRLAPQGSTMVTVAVTIGYDAPWRQVHALLQESATRTPGVSASHPPLVLQRALSDFFVEYQLVVTLDVGAPRPATRSALHAQIQDAFNAAGVQIMSPHFVAQPAAPVVVPPGHWDVATGHGDAADAPH